jgi:hypothetical protein
VIEARQFLKPAGKENFLYNSFVYQAFTKKVKSVAGYNQNFAAGGKMGRISFEAS